MGRDLRGPIAQPPARAGDLVPFQTDGCPFEISLAIPDKKREYSMCFISFVVCMLDGQWKYKMEIKI